MAKKAKMQPDTDFDQKVEKTVSNGLKEGESPVLEVKKRVIRIQFDIEYPGTKGKVMDGKSQTMPDMNLTVRQLLQNHVLGKDSKAFTQQPLYFDTTIPTLEDITDVETFRNHLSDRLRETDEFIRQERQTKKEAERQAAIEAKKLKDKQNPEGGKQLEIPSE